MVLPLTVPVSIASMKTGEFIRDNLPAAVSRDPLDDYKAVDQQVAVVPPLIALASAIGIAAGVSADLWLLFIPAALSWLLQVSLRSRWSAYDPEFLPPTR